MFLNELSLAASCKDQTLYKDLWIKASFLSNTNLYKGLCGFELCSNRYLEAIKKKIFRKSISSYCKGSIGYRNYRESI